MPVLVNSDDEWCWKSVDQNTIVKITTNPRLLKESVKNIVAKYELCITGVGYDYLAQNNELLLNELIAQIRIFARMSPKQKESVINRLKALGYTTLMCGDGTNDVGALKHSDVGVALLSHPFDGTKESLSEKAQAREKKIAEAKELSKEIRDGQVAKKSVGGHGPRRTDAPPGSRNAPSRAAAVSNAQAKLDQMLRELQEEEQQVVRLGDASIAAPFTSKFTSIQSICHVIKQGRCTLVVTLQMFKILALNALVLAYSQSVLYLDGVKFSDYQATIQGLLLAACFFFICRSEVGFKCVFKFDFLYLAIKNSVQTTSIAKHFQRLHFINSHSSICGSFCLSNGGF